VGKRDEAEKAELDRDHRQRSFGIVLKINLCKSFTQAGPTASAELLIAF
jgi:hypothetical protein